MKKINFKKYLGILTPGLTTLNNKFKSLFGKIPCNKIPLKDKGCHLIAGFVISGTALLVFSAITSLVIGVVIGLIKEAFDSINYNRWDTTDAIFTIIGSIIAVVVFTSFGILI
jgi:hypothetical protein